jgi:hypothetical protein
MRMKIKMENIMGVFMIVAALAIWLTHIITCFSAAAWGLLIAGALFPPIGVVHGIAILLGYPFV